LVRRYQEKGILTIKQLSYLFKPRRRGKRKKRGIVLYKPELQALALRTGKIYIQQMPEIQRRDVELFLDVEGIPDRKFYYLIGLLVCDGDNNSHYSFWAESSPDEKHIWQQFLDKVSEYPEAPIYHYGSFEPRAIRLMANRYQSQQGELKKRLVNLNSYIYGHLYFPTRSNRLKEIGDFIGAKWTAQDASGLQSLVWRHLWEETKKEEFKQTIILYNREDCQAIKLLADEICKIKSTADRQPNIDYADKPKKYSTEIGAEIHSQFQTILRFAHANYDSKKISFGETSPVEKNKRGLRKGHPGYHRAIPETAEVQHWPLREICPRCGDQNLIPAERVAQLIITDLVFTQNGLSKKTLRLEGNYGYCPKCYRHYGPESLHGYSAFGHGFQSWVIYQRFSLRLPYESIVQSLDEQFSESISPGGITEIIRRFGKFYKDTEKISLERMLASPFIHVDETKVNVQGIDHYVWVFTDGKRVILRVTETREATIVHEILEGFKGILVSDFYGGYDALPCLQQKCLVHLIRDLNDDLWKSPFDEEYQDFVLAVKKLIVPIMETVHNYGLKKEYLSVFQVKVEFFYKEVINGSTFSSELAQKYQKRFIRHKQNLFTFLDYDGIPWNNNTAERALRPLVVQENISKTFFKSIFQQHLLLLGIMQTCRFQQKSFLKFLISGQKDVDHFGLGNI